MNLISKQKRYSITIINSINIYNKIQLYRTLLSKIIVLSYVFFLGNTQFSMSYHCPVTPEIWELIAPPSFFHKTNNLRKKAEYELHATGVPIMITGKVMDENCIPIPSAIIRIWQKNYNGVYEHEDGNWQKKDKYFYGSGSAITDNFGNVCIFYNYVRRIECTASTHHIQCIA